MRTHKPFLKGKPVVAKDSKTYEATRAVTVARRPVKLKELEADFDYLGYTVPKGTLVPDVPLPELPGPGERTEANVAEVIALVLAGELLPYPHNRGDGHAAKVTIRSIVEDGIHATLGNMVFGYVNEKEHAWRGYADGDPRWRKAHQALGHGRMAGIIQRMVNGDMTLAEWQQPFTLVPTTDVFLSYKHDGLQGSAHTSTHRAVNPDLALGYLRQQVLDLLPENTRAAVNKTTFVGVLKSALLIAARGSFSRAHNTHTMYRGRGLESDGIAMERAGALTIPPATIRKIAAAIQYWAEVREEYINHPCRDASIPVLMNRPGMLLYILTDILCGHGNCHPSPEATAVRLVQLNGKLQDPATSITRTIKEIVLDSEAKITKALRAPQNRELAARAKYLRREQAPRKKRNTVGTDRMPGDDELDD